MPQTVTFQVVKGGNPHLGISPEKTERFARDIHDAEELHQVAEGLADEAVREHMGRITVTARLVLPARGGEDYGSDAFIVECRRNQGSDYSTGGF